MRDNIIIPGIRDIFLDEVACRGTEMNLTDCPHRGIGIHNCEHSEDAGVICPQGNCCMYVHSTDTVIVVTGVILPVITWNEVIR